MFTLMDDPRRSMENTPDTVPGEKWGDMILKGLRFEKVFVNGLSYASELLSWTACAYAGVKRSDWGVNQVSTRFILHVTEIVSLMVAHMCS